MYFRGSGIPLFLLSFARVVSVYIGKIVRLFWRFGTFLVLTLIFHPHHAILTPVTKPLKTRSYKGFADSRRKVILTVYAFRGIRQMSMQAWPPDSLLRENESCVRDLPHVKQN